MNVLFRVCLPIIIGSVPLWAGTEVPPSYYWAAGFLSGGLGVFALADLRDWARRRVGYLVDSNE